MENQELTMQDFASGCWNETLKSFSKSHILQTYEWGQFKGKFGWSPVYKTWRSKNGNTAAMAMILQKTLRLAGVVPFINIIYIPKGPVLNWGDSRLSRQVLSDLKRYGQSTGAVFIKMDPDIPIGYGLPDSEEAIETSLGRRILELLLNEGWTFSKDQIQFKNSMFIDLNKELDQVLAKMKQKTRYNIRLAGRQGVVIREGNLEDFDQLYRMYAETALRDGFVIRSQPYYKEAWSLFMKEGMACPLIAEYEGEAVSAVIPYYFNKKAWFLFGMSRNVHRNKMPNYLLQWALISQAKSFGCNEYDMWGAPDQFIDNDPMWGVYKFKSGFGAEVVRRIGAWDMVLKPSLYRFYTAVLPELLNVLRKRGKNQLEQTLSI